jgi:hypothetical protein
MKSRFCSSAGIQRFQREVLRALSAIVLIGLLGLATTGARAQSELSPIREIKLPIPHSRGLWFYPALNSDTIFSIQLTPSNDLLVYGVDKNGKWPLVKIQQWWTSDPRTWVLNTAGFSGKDGKNLESLAATLQVTPDGRYAVAVAGAEWVLPKDGVLRPAEVISSVIDLNQFHVQTVRNFHNDIRPLNDKYLALLGYESSNNASTYQLLSLPGLEPGPGCNIETRSQSERELNKIEQEHRHQDDVACAEVLRTSGIASIEDLKRLLTGRRSLVPKVFAQSPYLSGNAIFESPTGAWYTVDSIHSELAIWNSAGETQLKRKSSNLLCDNQPVRGPAWVCSCTIEGLENDHNVLLAACLTQHDNLLGWQVWLKQWLSVFRADDLSEIGFVRLSSKNEETKELIASVEGRTYILAVSLGDTLRIYELPAH